MPMQMNSVSTMQNPKVQTMMPQTARQTGGPLPPQQIIPQTGLIGSEMALQQGLQGSLGMLQQGGQAIQQGNMNALGVLGGSPTWAGVPSAQTANAANFAVPKSFSGSVGQGIDQGVGSLDPFRSAGMNAQGMEMAMLGGGTQEQQAAAMQQLESSPAFRFAQEQGERAIGRNQAAAGGLGSGTFQKELARFNQGLASQQFDTRLGQLSNVSGRGLQAAQGIGNLRGQQAQLGTNVSMGNAAARNRAGEVAAQLGTQVSMANAGAQNQMDMQRQGMLGQSSRQYAADQNYRDMTAAGIMSGQGSQIANLYGQGSQNVFGTGQMLSGGRTQAGRDIAGQIGGATSALAGLQNQQGSALADLYGGGATNIANIISGLAESGALDKNNMAQLLASIETGTAGQIATLPSAAALQNPIDYMGNTGRLMSSISGMANAWDQRAQTQPQVTQAYNSFDSGGYA